MIMIRGFALATALAMISVPGAAQKADARSDLPPDFRGRIVYQGSFSAQVFRAGVTTPNANARMRAIARRNDRSFQEDGTITLTVTFDGTRIQGSYVGSGGFGSGTFTGTREGSSCTVSEGRGDINTVHCDRASWSGVTRSPPGSRIMATTRIDARQSQFVDSRVEDEQRRIAAAAAVERARAAAAAYAALPSAGAALTRRLDGFVQTDSRGWAFNTYDSSSIANVKIIEGSAGTGNFVMQGYYTYNGGSRGWVMAKMSGGRLECIQFHDSVIGCRGLRTAEQGQAMRDAALGAAAGLLDGGPSGQSDSSSEGRDFVTGQQIQRQTQQQIENARPPN
ncbi:MAG TPA: hypothetical protein VIT45_16565 [Allosphingosinicella sp.]